MKFPYVNRQINFNIPAPSHPIPPKIQEDCLPARLVKFQVNIVRGGGGTKAQHGQKRVSRTEMPQRNLFRIVARKQLFFAPTSAYNCYIILAYLLNHSLALFIFLSLQNNLK